MFATGFAFFTRPSFGYPRRRHAGLRSSARSCGKPRKAFPILRLIEGARPVRACGPIQRLDCRLRRAVLISAADCAVLHSLKLVSTGGTSVANQPQRRAGMPQVQTLLITGCAVNRSRSSGRVSALRQPGEIQKGARGSCPRIQITQQYAVAVSPSGSQRPRWSGTRSTKNAIKVGGRSR